MDAPSVPGQPPERDNSRGWLARGAVVLVAVTVAATACGTDNARTSGSSTRSAAAATPFCGDYLAMAQAFSTAPWNGDPSTYPSSDAMKQYYDSKAKPRVEKLAGDDAPDEISTEIATQIDIARKFGVAADLRALEEPAYFESGDKTDVYAYENCDFRTVDVIGVDHAFTGLPSELGAGPAAFKFVNQGMSGEPHELVLLRKNDGVTQSFDDLLIDFPKAEASEQVTLVGKTLSFKDERSFTFADLEPGSYLALCSIPQGTISHTPGTGPPHFALGMKQEFTVR